MTIITCEGRVSVSVYKKRDVYCVISHILHRNRAVCHDFNIRFHPSHDKMGTSC